MINNWSFGIIFKCMWLLPKYMTTKWSAILQFTFLALKITVLVTCKYSYIICIIVLSVYIQLCIVSCIFKPCKMTLKNFVKWCVFNVYWGQFKFWVCKTMHRYNSAYHFSWSQQRIRQSDWISVISFIIFTNLKTFHLD